MNYRLLIIVGLILFSFWQCKEDESEFKQVVTGTNQLISGNFSFDTNGDGVGDSPAGAGYEVLLIDSMYHYVWNSPDSVNIPNDKKPLFATTDADGNYVFEDLVSFAENRSIFHKVKPAQSNADFNFDNPKLKYPDTATDNDVDGDPNEERLRAGRIDVALEEDEHDIGNDFIFRVYPSEISGSVSLDIDQDLSTTSDRDPLEGIEIQLIRYSQCNETTAQINLYTFTDSDGNYKFENNAIFPNFTIFHYEIKAVVGSGMTIIDSQDETPDGDGDDVDCPNILDGIVVGIDSEDEIDSNNNFVVINN